MGVAVGKSSHNPLPKVSLIMPVRNEAAFISRSLKCVLDQEYPQELLEIFVVDGMSTDGTREAIRGAQAAHPNIRMIDNHGKIVSTGFNVALSQATGEIIVRIDGHCEVSKDYVARCVAHLRGDGVGGVGGYVHTVGLTTVARAIAAAMSSRFGVGDSAFRTRQRTSRLVDTIPFPAYRRSVMQRAGPFDEELVRNQDDEYNYRLRKLGMTLLLADDISSEYYSRGTLWSFWRQYLQYGYWKVRVLQKHPLQMRPRQYVPPLFVAMLGISLLTWPYAPLGGLVFSLAGGSYLLGNVVASMTTARKNGWQLLPLLPLCFAILHFAYGTGFLYGLIKHANRWGDTGTQGRQLASTRPREL
jgi:succinoglycan biosynthesis protein ExoA